MSPEFATALFALTVVIAAYYVIKYKEDNGDGPHSA
jgi:hypothetical protein